MAEIKRSGKYKGKTRNLTQKQVASGRRVGKAGKATVGKKEAKRAMKPIEIQDTTWKKASERTGPRARGGIVVGKDGKPITGTVTLASGKTATYVRGKRVAAQTAKRPSGLGGRGGNGDTGKSRNIPTSRVAPSRRGEGSGPTKAQMNASRMGAEGPRRSMPKGKTGGSTVSIPGGVSISLSGSGKSKSKHKKGDRRRVSPFSTQMEVFDGTRWVKETK